MRQVRVGTRMINVHFSSPEPLEQRIQWSGGASLVTHSTAALSQAEVGLAAASVGNIALFAGGGVITTGPKKTVDIYDAATGRWSSAPSPHMGEPRAIAAAGGKILIAGGFSSVKDDGLLVDVYDPSTGRWSVTYSPQKRVNSFGLSVNNFALFVGGLRSGTADQFDAWTKRWKT